MSNVAHAHLSTLLPESGNAVQLLPLGNFSAQDGRPGNMKGVTCKHWVLTEERAREIVAAFANRKNKLLFDYEHAVLLLKGTGKPTPAAGWGEAMTVKADGLYAEPVTWTPKAGEMIANKEYLYTSPVFQFDKNTGEVLSVDMCAITNDPALDGMAELQVALSKLTVPLTLQGTNTMEALLERLRWLLNLPTLATPEEIIAELDKLKTSLGTDAQAAATFDLAKYLADLSGQSTQIAALTNQVATLERQTEPDPAKFVSVALLTSAQHTIATLTKRLNDDTVGTMIASAMKDGRLLGEADAQWAKAFASKHGADALQEALAARQAIPALAGTQTGGKQPTNPGTVSLTADQREAARLMGHTDAEYAAMLSI
jgi:phage I-like protein